MHDEMYPLTMRPHPTHSAKPQGGAQRATRRIAALCLVSAAALSALAIPSAGAARERVKVVIIDPGHGGDDDGAIGYRGITEKDIVLRFASQLGKKFESEGVQVIFTRTTDTFLSLDDRAQIANRTKADLFLSIHANAGPDDTARGPETYFVSVEASDEDAMRVALTENNLFTATEGPGADIVATILGDMVRTEHMRVSSSVAGAIQSQLARLPGPNRGVKQAPLAVLSGVNMPAVLIELGFLTNPLDASNLDRPSYRASVAEHVVRGVLGLAIIDRTPTRERDPEPTTGDAR